jgi:hypothetical protein
MMTWSESLLNAADENGCIPWIAARNVAMEHSLFDDFRTDYGVTSKFGPVDAGEFLSWLGY